MSDTPLKPKKLSRIQQRNRQLIMDAALDVFSKDGFRGSTLDQIAKACGLSKPNILYYFDGKEDIYITLLNRLIDTWLAPLHELNPQGDPLEEISDYIRRKMEMTRAFPRESRLFANEMIQGAPRMKGHLLSGVKPLFDRKTALLQHWMDEGKIASTDARHLLISIWATTQHYADFETQVTVVMDGADNTLDEATEFLLTMFRKTLRP
ncbi:TetR family transcriptional regulator C-terminal domain-containing protein [Cognatishimia sp. WU-CL00825]|uniref:TetR family transcriptional regulator C-terminal domain-containing protein n=1 Tax=Cognatishimia sp. WU-CL00825 TaxID=3127658 RepID=UPI0031021AF8